MGYCTHQIVCDEGSKGIGDYCDRSKECLSEICLNNQCQDENILFNKWIVVVIVAVILIVLMFILFLFICIKRL